MTDILIIGAGAAGLMTAIWAARTNPNHQITVLEGARKIGAKLLISGGTRCNVTHAQVDETAFAGSSRPAIKKVLRRFDVPQTITFFREIGVELKTEDTGKLFPTSDSAKTVLNALLREAERLGVRLKFPCRVEAIRRTEAGFLVSGPWGELEAIKIVLATGGKSLPKTGSDGKGYGLARSLGHSLTERIFPALVPLLLPQHYFLRELSGLTVPATLEVRLSNGKRLHSFTNSTLCTHFGLSGPAILDISRYFLDEQSRQPDVQLIVNWLPGTTSEACEASLLQAGKHSVLTHLREHLPERLLRALCEQAGVEPATLCNQLGREQRKNLVRFLTALPLPITGNRGFEFAEVTAGGIPLAEIHLNTMESRITPGLFLCGEICDVDGRIGGFNFQWAWASGYIAGTSCIGQ
ncbi:MAG: NAD(P)/FAD-dependent oxidoreductase [Blastocatellia bacterium]|nr:NAD(P)/FAD-dependent oxidoreductase [Blastocatellia bacterium]